MVLFSTSIHLIPLSLSLVYLPCDHTTAAVIIEAHQSSTNGSFVAGLGCDGDLDTFSMTNNGWNQSWTATTVNKSYDIVWIFVRIKAGSTLFNWIIMQIPMHALLHWWLCVIKNGAFSKNVSTNLIPTLYDLYYNMQIHSAWLWEQTI